MSRTGDPTGDDRERLLITAFVELADTLVDDYDVIDLLDRLAGYSMDLLAADAAGILPADTASGLRVVASTNEQSGWMELLQLEAEEGPGAECIRTGTPISIVDLTDTTSRWPGFVAELAQRGDLSMDAAFDRLRRYARRHHQRLSELARQVVETGVADQVLAVRTTATPPRGRE